jgi:exosome complex exonuclease RRP6
VASSAEVAVASTTDTPADGAMAEIAFVPAPLRQTVKADVVDDAIVVVGQRQKKRKRTKKTEASGLGGGSTPTEHAKAEQEEIVPFDFASAPNILDDIPSEQEDGGSAKRRRAKKRSGGFPLISYCVVWPYDVASYDDLGTAFEREGPAKPRDRRGVKSGNVTHTFRP